LFGSLPAWMVTKICRQHAQLADWKTPRLAS
jgi:hypothetical protein